MGAFEGQKLPLPQLFLLCAPAGVWGRDSFPPSFVGAGVREARPPQSHWASQPAGHPGTGEGHLGGSGPVPTPREHNTLETQLRRGFPWSPSQALLCGVSRSPSLPRPHGLGKGEGHAASPRHQAPIPSCASRIGVQRRGAGAWRPASPAPPPRTHQHPSRSTPPPGLWDRRGDAQSGSIGSPRAQTRSVMVLNSKPGGRSSRAPPPRPGRPGFSPAGAS